MEWNGALCVCAIYYGEQEWAKHVHYWSSSLFRCDGQCQGEFCLGPSSVRARLGRSHCDQNLSITLYGSKTAQVASLPILLSFAYELTATKWYKNCIKVIERTKKIGVR